MRFPQSDGQMWARTRLPCTRGRALLPLLYGPKTARSRCLTACSSGTPFQNASQNGVIATLDNAAGTINVFAQNWGWLFDDLKSAIAAKGALSTERPDPDARSWICIRTAEAAATPDISRTVVQVHDQNDYDIGFLNSAGIVHFTHPLQHFLWRRKGFRGAFEVIPIGARRGVQGARTAPAKPTVGYFTGELSATRKGKRTDMVAEAVEIARRKLDFRFLMIGRHLDYVSHLGEWHDRAADTFDYKDIDLLVTCSPSLGIPLSVYECCSVGIPVVTTPRWFPEPAWPNIFTGRTADEIADHIVCILKNRAGFFEGRIRNSFAPYLFENWVDRQIESARVLSVPARTGPASST